MIRTWLVIGLIVAGVAAAWAIPASQQIIIFGGGSSATGGGGSGSNFILMIDNTSRILQTDNASKICTAGGC